MNQEGVQLTLPLFCQGSAVVVRDPVATRQWRSETGTAEMVWGGDLSHWTGMGGAGGYQPICVCRGSLKGRTHRTECGSPIHLPIVKRAVDV